MIPSWSYEIIGKSLIKQNNKEYVNPVKKSDSEISMENVLNSIDSMDIEMLSDLLEDFESNYEPKQLSNEIITDKEICLWKEISNEIKGLLGCNYDLLFNICEIFI